MGRGGRSAIGSHGFFHGGLLVDRGRTEEQPIAPLDFQTSFPDDWPIVLATLHRQAAVSGTDESVAFSTLPDATQRQTDGLIELVNQKLVPAVAMQDYAAFGESVYTLSRQSGLFFQTVQGGPYNGREIERFVNVVRDFGVPAVGQSSLGALRVCDCPRHRDRRSLAGNTLNNSLGIVATHKSFLPITAGPRPSGSEDLRLPIE